MRDDLHKAARVPRRWRRFIQVSARDASWNMEGPRCAHEAVRNLVGELHQAPLKHLKEFLSDGQLSLDPARSVDNLRRTLRLNPMLNSVFDEVRFEIHRGSRPEETQELLISAVKKSLNDSIEDHLRATQGHVDRVDPKCTGELLSRMRKLVASVPVEEMVRKVVLGDVIEGAPAKRPLDLDEDLLTGG